MAWIDTFGALEHHGEAPIIHIFDNDCSNNLKKVFTTTYIISQVVPHVHGCYSAERTMHNFKSHPITCLHTCDSRLQIKGRNRIIQNAIITLNLLRSSRRNLLLSVHASVFGKV